MNLFIHLFFQLFFYMQTGSNGTRGIYILIKASEAEISGLRTSKSSSCRGFKRHFIFNIWHLFWAIKRFISWFLVRIFNLKTWWMMDFHNRPISDFQSCWSRKASSWGCNHRLHAMELGTKIFPPLFIVSFKHLCSMTDLMGLPTNK